LKKFYKAKIQEIMQEKRSTSNEVISEKLAVILGAKELCVEIT